MVFRGFLQGLLGIVCGIALVGTECNRLYELGKIGMHGYISPDLSWEHVAPLYIVGMLIVFCGLVTVRISLLCDEAKHGPDVPYGTDENDRTGVWGSLLFWLPSLPNRSESYLWSFTLLSTLLTFFLRDQSLNWMVSQYGFRDPHTVMWDWISLVGAPISAVVLTMRWLAVWRVFLQWWHRIAGGILCARYHDNSGEQP